MDQNETNKIQKKFEVIKTINVFDGKTFQEFVDAHNDMSPDDVFNALLALTITPTGKDINLLVDEILTSALKKAWNASDSMVAGIACLFEYSRLVYGVGSHGRVHEILQQVAERYHWGDGLQPYKPQCPGIYYAGYIVDEVKEAIEICENLDDEKRAQFIEELRERRGNGLAQRVQNKFDRDAILRQQKLEAAAELLDEAKSTPDVMVGAFERMVRDFKTLTGNSLLDERNERKEE